MLETSTKVNRNFVCLKPVRFYPVTRTLTMKKIIIQIYEVQNPAEAENLIDIGVDHIGSVILSERDWKIPEVKETVELIRSSTAKSSLIPLYNSLDSVLHTLDYYQPDVVHFCEALTDQKDVWGYCRKLVRLQEDVKKRFPQILIMRSIPIAPPGGSHLVPTLDLAKVLEPISDYFLTDTLLIGDPDSDADSQPVQGFVGITGQTCSWHTAAELVAASNIPVILAGGISPGNVTEGILQIRPDGIDSCTRTNALDDQGVPIRFKKDIKRVKDLVSAVREAEKTLGG
jgi:phosphoribosylanthranilate isomerase